MSVYFDPSAIIGLMLANEDCEPVADFLAAQELAIPINALQEFELKNAVRQKVHRGEISEGEVIAAFRRFDDMFVLGDFAPAPVDFAAVFAQAGRCSKRFCLRHGGRAFDILHVAAALVGGARKFVTFDAEQAALAKRAELRLIEF